MTTERMEEQLSVRAPAPLMRVLEETAAREQRSTGSLVRRILVDWSEGRLIYPAPRSEAAA
jgi:hypothetical protein